MNNNIALIADIGGTNARFGIVDSEGLHNLETLECKDFDGPTDAAQTYLKNLKEKVTPRLGVFAVAGPVMGDLINFTNLRWSFRASKVQGKIGLESLEVMNDFKAVALAIPAIDKDLIFKIGGGDKMPDQSIGVIGPGTGLGVASLIWSGSEYIAQPGEGGHVTMPAKTQREFDIFDQMHVKYRHISAERVCSGKGLENLYVAIRALDNKTSLPNLNAKEISTLGQSGECDVCNEALELMLSFLGRIAGNLALTINAHGGVYIAGGIPTKLGDYFLNSNFLNEFQNKGRMSEKMQQIPVYMVKHSAIGLLGLTQRAQNLLRS